jgi:hypothetical protein
MTEIYEHPKPPVQHKPRIQSAEVGCQVTCLCGWSAAAVNPGRATAAYLDHLKREAS